jgi:putative ABC transport system ATP-binding protein
MLMTLRSASKIYGEGETRVVALDRVDLEIDSGEFVAFMGPSGSGKSTCLNILGCLDAPTSGEYLFRGVPTAKLSAGERAMLRRESLGFVFQGFNLLARTSATENVEMPLLYRGVKSRERTRRALAALAAVGLAGREAHTPSQLSGGQQQRVAITRALITDPTVVLADEPTGNVDSVRATEIMEILAALNRDRGITIVMVTHETDMAAYAKRVVSFRDGRIASDQRQQPFGAAA